MKKTKAPERKAPKKKAPIRKSVDQTNRTAIKKARFLKAFQLKGCNISKACSAAGVGRSAFYEWKSADPAFAAAVFDLEEADLDFTEDQLQKKIRKGNLIAIIFKLKCKAKHRGYIEKTEVGGNVNLTHQLTMEDLNRSLAACEKEAQG